MKKMLAGLVLATSLVACSDRAPQVIAVPQSAPMAAPPVAPGVMTVAGSATLEVAPDCADMTLTLTTDGPRPGAAASQLTKKQQDVISNMKKLGIDEKDMKISQTNLAPVYRDWPDRGIKGYRAEITITVTTKKFDLVAPMMEAAANAGAQSMSTQFRRSDLPELKKKVREMALRAAKEKAELTVKTLGIGLGRVTQVAEVPVGHMWSHGYFPSNLVANEAAQIPAQAQQVSVLGGATQTLSLDITIGYELAKS